MASKEPDEDQKGDKQSNTVFLIEKKEILAYVSMLAELGPEVINRCKFFALTLLSSSILVVLGRNLPSPQVVSILLCTM